MKNRISSIKIKPLFLLLIEGWTINVINLRFFKKKYNIIETKSNCLRFLRVARYFLQYPDNAELHWRVWHEHCVQVPVSLLSHFSGKTFGWSPNLGRPSVHWECLQFPGKDFEVEGFRRAELWIRQLFQVRRPPDVSFDNIFLRESSFGKLDHSTSRFIIKRFSF